MSAERRQISARLELLDHQLVDAERLPFGRVDDIELSLPADSGPPQVDAILTGAQALGERLGGLIGGSMAAFARRLRTAPADGPVRLDPELIEELEPAIKLRVPLAELNDVAGLERWLGRRIERLAGGGRAVD